MKRQQPSRMQHRVVEYAVQIDEGDNDMPFFKRFIGLHETLSRTADFGVPAFEQTGGSQHTVDAAGADGDDIAVELHKGLATVALQGIVHVKIDDCLLLPVFKPEITG